MDNSILGWITLEDNTLVNISPGKNAIGNKILSKNTLEKWTKVI